MRSSSVVPVFNGDIRGTWENGLGSPMTSATHALIGLAIGSLVVPRVHARAYLVIGALCAVLPDVDLLAPYFGGDRDFHRRFTHSVFFAGLFGIACGFAAPHSRFQGRQFALEPWPRCAVCRTASWIC